MNPKSRKRFRKKLTLDRVVPIISASVSWLIFSMAGVGSESWPKLAIISNSLGIEEVIQQISFHSGVAGEHVCQKCPGKLWFTVEQIKHDSLFDSHDGAGLKRARSGNTQLLVGNRALPEKTLFSETGDNGFLAARRYNGKLHLAGLDVKDCIGQVTLRKDRVISLVFAYRFSSHNPG
jgi:hypothetical protein